VFSEDLVNTKVVVNLLSYLVSKFGDIWPSSLGVIVVWSCCPEMAALCLERTDSGTLRVQLGRLGNQVLRSENEL
jgi:hypothetical protein